jgi:hypothetical protein
VTDRLLQAMMCTAAGALLALQSVLTFGLSADDTRRLAISVSGVVMVIAVMQFVRLRSESRRRSTHAIEGDPAMLADMRRQFYRPRSAPPTEPGERP